MNKAVIILGMHRSGTSALARICNLLGLELGSPLMPPGPGNETGFWEHADVVRLHEELLDIVGRHWDSITPFPEGWAESEAVAPIRQQIATLVREQFVDASLWGVKDPRMCRTMPLWHPILAEQAAEPHALLINRHPFEVGRSLHVRDGFSLDRGLILWMLHALEAERDTRGMKRAFVSYPDLLSDWQTSILLAGEQIGIQWLKAPEEIADEVGAFLKPGLRHHTETAAEGEGKIQRWALEVHRVLVEAEANGQPDTARLDAVRAEVLESLGPVTYAVDVLERHAACLSKEIHQTRHKVEIATADFRAADDRATVATAEVERTHGELARTNQELDTAHRSLREYGQAVEALRSEVVVAHQALKEQQQAFAELQEHSNRRIAEVQTAAAQQAAELHRVIAEQQSVIAARDQQIAGIYASTSWRITRPIRALRYLARALPARLRYRRLPAKVSAVPSGLVLEPAQQQSLPAGWFKLRFRTTPTLADAPLVLHAVGGNQAVSRQLVPWHPGSMDSHVLCLPAGVTRLELHASANSRDVAFEHGELIEYGSAFALARHLGQHLSQFVRDPELGRRRIGLAITMLRQGDLRTPIDRLFGRREGRHSVGDYAEWVARYDTLTVDDWQTIRARLATMAYKPLISIIMPVYNTPERLLREAIESVLHQAYDRWELCIADDASSAPHVRALLQEYAARDRRIKVLYRTENGNISAASNSALSLATGEFIAGLDHDDVLREHALYVVAEYLNRYPEAAIVYSDEDKIDEHGARYHPHFKSDWNRDLFLSMNYLNHLTVIRRSLVEQAEGWRLGFEGAQDYDLLLRILERLGERADSERIVHAPFILYHWRATPGSTALHGDQKTYATSAALRALQEYLERCGIDAVAEPGWDPAYQRVRYAVPDPQPLVSLIIPTKDKVDLLRGCVEGILRRTDYDNFEILIANNRSEEPETFRYFKEVTRDPRVRVLDWDFPYNYAAVNNFAAREARGEILGLINNDIEVIHDDWLKEMVGHALRPEVGAVGALLYYGTDAVQHAGVIIGLGGVAGHSHKHRLRHDPGYFHRAKVIQELSAVTAACLLVRKDVYEAHNGLDEDTFAVAFNDVDFCLRLRRSGYRIIWTPHAELYHLESASRGSDDTPETRPRFQGEIMRMKERWGEGLLKDPFYSPNLTLDTEDFGIAFPPRAARPWLTAE